RHISVHVGTIRISKQTITNNNTLLISKWESGFELCLLYVYSDVFLCTASIVHMSVISVDRYLGISNPLKMRNRSKTMIILKIVFVWMVTLTISCPIAIVALIDPTNILSQSQCAITNRLYMIYGSTFAFLIPSFIMAITYVKTKNLLTKQASLLSETAVQKSKGEGLRRTLPRRAPISRFEFFGCFFICWTPFFAANLANGFLGDKCDIPPSISSLFLWLGYVSSIINPLIYTIFNRYCFKPLVDTSSANYSRSHIYPPADTNTW
uniref:G_PROTEIN_RECEP_F1_2 domain-containing protein n=1 Tax=Syphacia muris TaxID=451379 RepID=A0A0N5AY44_9BILA